jgi:hypothetical protein
MTTVANVNNLNWPTWKIYNLHAGPHGGGTWAQAPLWPQFWVFQTKGSSELSWLRNPTNSGFFFSNQSDPVFKYYNRYICMDLKVNAWLKEGHTWPKYMPVTHTQGSKRLRQEQTSGWGWTSNLQWTTRPEHILVAHCRRAWPVGYRLGNSWLWTILTKKKWKNLVPKKQGVGYWCSQLDLSELLNIEQLRDVIAAN